MRTIDVDKLYAQYQELCKGIACMSCPFLNTEDNKCELESMILQQPIVAEPVEFEWCHDCKEYDQNAHCCHRWTKVIRNTVNDLKTQGYEMVKHGHWVGIDDRVWECDNCGWIYEDDEPYYNFCPHCGSKMDVSDTDDGKADETCI